jgi:hypothetical protein
MNNPFNPQFPSVMKHDFAKVPRIGVNRSAFKSNPRYVTMFDAGKLIPFLVFEVIPGDTIKLDNSMLCRLNTPIVPFMDNLYLDTQYFFVPNRLVWTNWEKFMGAKDNPADSTTYTIPVVTGPAAGFLVETIYDYMGIPINMTKDVNALPLRAYNLIYNEFFRDQNIINSVANNTGDGPDTDTDYTIQRRGKRHDYFTSCLPAPQQGSAGSFSLTGDAPITGFGGFQQVYSTTNNNIYETDASAVRNPTKVALSTTNMQFVLEEDPNNTGFPNVRANLQGVSGITISEFRETIQLQALAEIENRGGHRYIEILYSVFNVISPDFRLARPEYLGGSSTPIYVVPVAQTAITGGSASYDAKGGLAGYGAGFKQRDGFTKSFTEHGYIIGICSVRADLTYSQGLHRMWTRSTKYDFFNPLLQNIGDQAVLQQEIFLSDNDSAADATVFGYQERYAEYMYMPSLITGKLRPAYATPLDYWHLSQEFASAPTLSQTFIEENPPIDRVVAVTSEPDFVLDVHFDATLVRPMELHSIPGFLGRF